MYYSVTNSWNWFYITCRRITYVKSRLWFQIRSFPGFMNNNSYVVFLLESNQNRPQRVASTVPGGLDEGLKTERQAKRHLWTVCGNCWPIATFWLKQMFYWSFVNSQGLVSFWFSYDAVREKTSAFMFRKKGCSDELVSHGLCSHTFLFLFPTRADLRRLWKSPRSKVSHRWRSGTMAVGYASMLDVMTALALTALASSLTQMAHYVLEG